MTQRNIYAMDAIVNKLEDGMKFSNALNYVYNKRNVCIPYCKRNMDTPITNIGLSRRSLNSLMRAKLLTIGHVVDFCGNRKITDVATIGRGSGIEIFEAVLDCCWDNMTEKEKTAFLIDTVERNEENLRDDIF
jgi:DNA-directed RNA polymerase alpha subunit